MDKKYKRTIYLMVLVIVSAAVPAAAFNLETDILEKAQTYLGTPYVYGGESPRGFDCSGFVYFLYKDYLSSWPRATRGQSSMGEPVPRSGLKPGDLTFWATGSDPNRVTHVSIYLGNDSVIHALSEGPRRGIAVSDMNSRYWKNKYLFSRRVLPAAAAPAVTVSSSDPATRVFPRGTYRGALKDGEPEGQGTLELNNGDVYTGSFKAGLFHGPGRYTAADGSATEGIFFEGYLKETAPGNPARVAPDRMTYVHQDNPWDDREGTADIPPDWETQETFRKVWQADMDAFEAARKAEEEALKAWR